MQNSLAIHLVDFTKRYKLFDEYHEKYLEFIPTEKQERIYKFRFIMDKKLGIFSDLFVSYLACSMLNLNYSDLVFGTNDFGKPYLVGYPNFHYNISHTRNAVIIGISENPIGVDIEKVKSAEIGIAERFFCKNELKYILSRSREFEKSFCEIWTKKDFITYDSPDGSSVYTLFCAIFFYLSMLYFLFTNENLML